MNIRQLQYFCSVVRTGSFSRAAHEVGVSVQAVSKSIVELESELGFALFERGNKGAQPTAGGWELYQSAKSAVESFEGVERHADYIQERHQRPVIKRKDLRLTLVYPPFSKNELVCAGFSLLFSNRIGVRTRMMLSLGPAALASLIEGDIDAFFTIGAYENPSCDSMKVGVLPTGIFLPRDHPLNDRHLLSFDDLAPYPMLINADLLGFNETIEDLYISHGLSSRVIICPTLEDMYDHIESDHAYVMGVGIPALSVKPISILHRFCDQDALSIPVFMHTLKGDTRSEVMRLRQFIRQGFSDLAGVFNV